MRESPALAGRESQNTRLGIPAPLSGESEACMNLRQGVRSAVWRGSQPLMGAGLHSFLGALVDQVPRPGFSATLSLAQRQGRLSWVWGLKPLSLAAPIPTIAPSDPLLF